MSELFAARRRAERYRRALRIGFGALVIAATLAGAWLVFFSSVLAVEKVAVKGVTTLAVRDVLAAAEVQLGGPLARLDTDAVRDKVAKLRPVDEVDVSRSWPHTVTITVRERVAIAWTSRGGRVQGVDREGVAFREFSTPPQLIEIRAVTFDADDFRRTLASLAMVVVDLRTEYPQLLGSSTYISADTRDSIEVHLRGGRLVVWGSASQAQKKAEVLRVLLRQVTAQRYDVSAPEQPTTAN